MHRAKRKCASTVEIEDTKSERRVLLSCHVRPGGDSLPHVCAICHCKLVAWSDAHPLWIQSSCCSEVWHAACIYRHVLARSHGTSKWRCPQCTAEHSDEVVDDWTQTEAYGRLFPHEEYLPPPEAAAHPSPRRRSLRGIAAPVPDGTGSPLARVCERP